MVTTSKFGDWRIGRDWPLDLSTTFQIISPGLASNSSCVHGTKVKLNLSLTDSSSSVSLNLETTAVLILPQ